MSPTTEIKPRAESVGSCLPDCCGNCIRRAELEEETRQNKMGSGLDWKRHIKHGVETRHPL
ncbi:hypothetical protein EYF80_011328 [Liparis tanakae]|uniref:Uncharacterized protein n=1 Tax=Liparis tanakae TaxID=230148 RepID=A0A4Z2ILL1_9TELE|nr:hypothetical protein EYF80_011328 [Liparis tanakae]